MDRARKRSRIALCSSISRHQKVVVLGRIDSKTEFGQEIVDQILLEGRRSAVGMDLAQ